MNNTLRYILLKPLSMLYGIGVDIRNKLFDNNKGRHNLGDLYYCWKILDYFLNLFLIHWLNAT